MRQIIDGLAENALRVTPAGAPIVLAVRAEPDAAVVEVRDGGPGLSDDDLAVAFERGVLYERYRGVRQVGTGLGLALVAGLARRLGGSGRRATRARRRGEFRGTAAARPLGSGANDGRRCARPGAPQEVLHV